MIPHRDHSTDTEMDEEEDDAEHGDESAAMWMGLVALSAIFCFFAIERMFLLCSDFKKRRLGKLVRNKVVGRVYEALNIFIETTS